MRVKYLVLGLTALGTIGLIVKRKVTDWRQIMEQLRAVPTGFNSLKIATTGISFNIDVTLFNPSNKGFNPDGIIAQLDRVEVLVKGQKIATVMIKKHSVKIPANGKLVLKNLRVLVPLTNLLYVKNIRSYADINTVAIINVLGEEFSI